MLVVGIYNHNYMYYKDLQSGKFLNLHTSLFQKHPIQLRSIILSFRFRSQNYL